MADTPAPKIKNTQGKKLAKKPAPKGQASAGEYRLLKLALRRAAIFLISLGIVAGMVYFAADTAYSRFLKPMDLEDSTPINVEVPMGTTINGIAAILYEKGLIRNTGVFKLLVDLSNKANRMQAGKYSLSKDMPMRDMIDILMTGRVSVTTVRITLREGLNIRQMADELVNKYKMPFTEEQFISAAKNINRYADHYTFLNDIPDERRNSDYPLEGYLFPDTYYVFADDTPHNIIMMMLREFDRKFDDEMRARAEELDMTIDEVVNLASIVQMEAGLAEEFPKIAAVFLNRIRIGMRLESCATVNYAHALRDPEGERITQVNLTTEQTRFDSPFNTYLVDGLPLGPISSPGLLALRSVLYPHEEDDFMDPDRPILFFVLKDPRVRNHDFNYDYQQHIRDRNRNRDTYWNR